MGNNCPSPCCEAELSRSANHISIDLDSPSKSYKFKNHPIQNKPKKPHFTAKKSLDFQSREREEFLIQKKESLSKKSSPFETFNEKYTSRELKNKKQNTTSSKYNKGDLQSVYSSSSKPDRSASSCSIHKQNLR